MTDVGPIPMARFVVTAAFRRRRVRPMSHSFYSVRVLAGSLLLDASDFPPNAVGTLGLVEASVLGGRLEIWLPPGVDVVLRVTERFGGRVTAEVGQDRQRPHLLVSGVVGAGTIRIVAGH